ncbi:MAG: hypothetical protein HY390_07335 [Deltaproteobacteria bacterium]|nr:hypothetical protein [Deltaproteobacteria bacterium]
MEAISLEAAQHQIIEAVASTQDVEDIHVRDALGRVVACDYEAPFELPQEGIYSGAPLLIKKNRFEQKNIGLLASFGVGEIQVFRKPRVACFSVGDDWVPIGQKMEEGQRYPSNALSLELLFKKEGCEFLDLGICKSNLEAQMESFKDAKNSGADWILAISAFAEKGIVPSLLDLGAHIYFHKVNMKPGKSSVFAKLDEKFIFGLPGDPLSNQVVFYQLMYPAIQKWFGEANFFIEEKKAWLSHDITLESVPKFMVGFQKEIRGQSYVLPFEERLGVSALSLGDCLIRVPSGKGVLEKNSSVMVQAY